MRFGRILIHTHLAYLFSEPIVAIFPHHIKVAPEPDVEPDLEPDLEMAG
jgi:hypothetical protein